MWLDSSVKVVRGDLKRTFNKLLQTGGAVLQSSTGHSTFAATHKTMYEYLPTDISKMKQNEQWEATLFIYKTREIVHHVLKWFVLCSLDEQCIAPIRERACSFHPVWEERNYHFADCHRFDQSAINILLNNQFRFDNWFFYVENSCLRVIRGYTNSAKVQTCSRSKVKQKEELVNNTMRV